MNVFETHATNASSEIAPIPVPSAIAANTSGMVAATAKVLVSRSGLAFEPAEQLKITDIITSYLAAMFSDADEVRAVATNILSADFTADDAGILIEQIIDEQTKMVAVLNMATTQLPVDGEVVATDSIATIATTSDEKSENDGIQPFFAIEASTTDDFTSGRDGRDIDTNIRWEKCGASLDQYRDHRDHSPTTSWSSSDHSGCGDVRTMLRIDPSESSTDDDLDIADDSNSEIAQADRIAVIDADFFNLQIWYNPDPPPGQSYWSIKVRASEIPDELPDELPMTQYDLHFRNGPREFRKSIKVYLESGKIDQKFYEHLHEASLEMGVNTKIAILSQPVHKKFVKVAKGKSSREIRFVDCVYAALETDRNKDQPISLTIMHSNREPIVITDFDSTAGTLTKKGRQRKENAAGWIAKYDPDNVFSDFKRERRAYEDQAATNRDLTTYNPVNRIGKFIKHFVAPVAAQSEDNASQIEGAQKSIMILSNQIRQQDKEIDALRREIAEMRQLIASITKPDRGAAQ